MEAISHLTKGLELLKTLPDTPERAQQELTLQITLGTPLMATKGYAAPEVERAYTPGARTVPAGGRNPSALPGAVRTVGILCQSRQSCRRPYELGEQLLSWPKVNKTRPSLLQAHLRYGRLVIRSWRVASAREHLEQGIALYDPSAASLSTPFSMDMIPRSSLSVLCSLDLVAPGLSGPSPEEEP